MTDILQYHLLLWLTSDSIRLAIAVGDIIKYQSFVYGSFVWGIHVRYNKIIYTAGVTNFVTHSDIVDSLELQNGF